MVTQEDIKKYCNFNIKDIICRKSSADTTQSELAMTPIKTHGGSTEHCQSRCHPRVDLNSKAIVVSCLKDSLDKES